jgi:hypothetical protein
MFLSKLRRLRHFSVCRHHLQILVGKKGGQRRREGRAEGERERVEDGRGETRGEREWRKREGTEMQPEKERWNRRSALVEVRGEGRQWGRDGDGDGREGPCWWRGWVGRGSEREIKAWKQFNLSAL